MTFFGAEVLPVQVGGWVIATIGLFNIIGSLAAGSVHTCAVLATNRATCWGGNFEAQLGDDTLVSARPFPSSVVKP